MEFPQKLYIRMRHHWVSHTLRSVSGCTLLAHLLKNQPLIDTYRECVIRMFFLVKFVINHLPTHRRARKINKNRMRQFIFSFSILRFSLCGLIFSATVDPRADRFPFTKQQDVNADFESCTCILQLVATFCTLFAFHTA